MKIIDLMLERGDEMTLNYARHTRLRDEILPGGTGTVASRASDHARDLIFTEEEWKAIAGQLRISRRQEQIARMLLHGYSDKQVAFELKIGLPTVRTHLARLYSKLSAQDRVEVVIRLFRAFRKCCCPIN